MEGSGRFLYIETRVESGSVGKNDFSRFSKRHNVHKFLLSKEYFGEHLVFSYLEFHI